MWFFCYEWIISIDFHENVGSFVNENDGSLLRNSLSFGYYMGITEKVFLKKYVISFKEHLPLLPDVYKGLIHRDDVM